MEQDFEAAAALLEKGYRCLHERFVPETFDILYSTRDISHFLPEKDKIKIPEVLGKLSNELSQLDQTVITDIADELKYLITNETLISLCNTFELDYDPEEAELPHYCDFIILNAVANYATDQFDIKKIPITEKTLVDACND